jgi:hypothetical protein
MIPTDPPAPIQKSRGGRPPAKEPGSSLTIWVPTRAHDRLVQLAARDNRTVSAYVRSLVILQLRDDNGD